MCIGCTNGPSAVQRVTVLGDMASDRFLLDDDDSNPFQAAEVTLRMSGKNLYKAMPLPEQLQGNKAFDFLQYDLDPTSLGHAPSISISPAK